MIATAAGEPQRLRRDLRLFASPASVPRRRRVLDALTLAAAVAGLALLAWWGQPTRDFERSLAAAAAAAPSWLHAVFVLAYDVVLAVPIVVVVAAVVRRRWPILLQCAIAGGVALAAVAATAALATAARPGLSEAAGVGDGVLWPAATVAIAASLLLATASDVTVPVRSLGAWVLAFAVLIAVLAGRSTLTGALAALLVAAAAAAAARLIVGTTAGQLSEGQVVELLDALGLRAQRVEWLKVQRDGLLLAGVRGLDDEPLLVKIHGRDAAESRRIERLWRALVYRDGSAAFAQARAPGLDREALATLLAAAHGVPVWAVAAAGRPDGAAEGLALRVDGTLVGDLPAGAVDAEAARSAWEALRALHAGRIAHLDLGSHALALRADGTISLTAFTDAVTACDPEEMRTDEAQLLVCLAVLLGPERALAVASEALGGEHLAGVLPYLQGAALPAELRAAVRLADLDVDELRAAAAAATGTEEPQLARLRRVTLGGLVRTGLFALAAAAIVPALAGVDLDRLGASLEQVSWPLFGVAFVVAQLPRLAQTVSTLGSVPARLPFGPVYVMQLATGFLNVALPSGIARMALTVRFFQRQGVAPATAVAAGLIDSFLGNVLQAVLLVALLVFGSTSLDLDLDLSIPQPGNGALLLAAIVLVALAVAAYLARPLLRRLAARVRALVPDARAALQPLRDGRKLAQLVGGNLAAELLFACALMLFVRAFGVEIGLVEVLFVNMSASLLVSVVPIPGGIGVAEASLILGLTRAGVDEETAFAAAVSYRLATFYMPPAWGFLAFRWLGRKGYV